MKSCVLAPVLAGLLVLLGACSPSRTDPRSVKPTSWQVGYWLWDSWNESPLKDASREALDILYVQREALSKVLGSPWSEDLPAAREYVVVWRVELLPDSNKMLARLLQADTGRLPDPAGLAEDYQALKKEATRKRLGVSGLQIDFDCPTDELPSYGNWLKQLRAALPKEQISITALLDWFRPGTAIEAVLEPVDEFVPQFYDTGREKYAIAERIDPDVWAPRFEACQRRYRIGISTFGRIYKSGKQEGLLQDVSLLNLAATSGLSIHRTKTRAGELVLEYQSKSDNARVGDYYLRPGEKLRAVLPTIESVGIHYKAAKRFGPYCAGVLFFRWPNEGETTVLEPDEIRQAMTGEGERWPIAPGVRLEAEDGGCAVVNCSDLYVRISDRYSESPLVLRIEPSSALDYFLPGPSVQIRQLEPRRMVLELPAYSGLRGAYLGRAFSPEKNDYRLRLEGLEK